MYSFGRYKGDFSPLVIEDILAIPGCEGSTISDAQSPAVFGLGFDGIATLSALDQLEPNIVYAYVASPGAAELLPLVSLSNRNDLFPAGVPTHSP